MKQRLQSILILGVIMGAICLAKGFSLLGPLNGNAWQVNAIGYNWAGDIGSPVNLNEEYRWNTPTITYAFDQSFLNYFGLEGVRAVEAAIKVLNDLPPVSRMSTELNEYPTDNKRANYTAQALGIQDVKSVTLSTLLEIMGLATPERWVYCLRDRGTYTSANITYTNYLVIQRNFDPVTYQPTNRVNSIFYGYTIEDPYTPGTSDAVEVPFDSVGLLPYSSVAGGYLNAGFLYTGLTRDDVGGIRYLLRYRNYNMETLPANVQSTNQAFNATNAVTNVVYSVTTNSPWRIYLGSTNLVTTNNIYTNIYYITNPPWTIYVPLTNQLATNALTNIVVTNAVGTNLLIQAALRPGLEKITFVRTYYDSLLGQAYRPITNLYNDVMITNFIIMTQRVQRVCTAPDILFAAQDLGTVGGAAGVLPVIMSRNVNFINNDNINGQTPHAGPGNLSGPVVISFSDILPGLLNESGPNYELPGWSNNARTMVWGSFDATMDVPITIYPSWISLQELEALMLYQ